MTKNTALTAHLHSHPACNLVHWVFIQYRSDQIGVLHTAPGSGLQTQNKSYLKIHPHRWEPVCWRLQHQLLCFCTHRWDQNTKTRWERTTKCVRVTKRANPEREKNKQLVGFSPPPSVDKGHFRQKWSPRVSSWSGWFQVYAEHLDG